MPEVMGLSACRDGWGTETEGLGWRRVWYGKRIVPKAEPRAGMARELSFWQSRAW